MSKHDDDDDGRHIDDVHGVGGEVDVTTPLFRQAPTPPHPMSARGARPLTVSIRVVGQGETGCCELCQNPMVVKARALARAAYKHLPKAELLRQNPRYASPTD